MRRKWLWLLISCLMAAALVLASCGPAAEEEEVAEEEEEEWAGTGNWWDKFGKPQYGGTITIAVASTEGNFDPMNYMGTQHDYWYESLWKWDWTVDREDWPFAGSFVPDNYFKGQLAESWEMPDLQTIVAHLRQGVYWQDKPPANGREFTAYDVQHHYDRQLGTGSGYTEGSPTNMGRMTQWDRVVAIDNYTVEFRFKAPSASNFASAAGMSGINWIECPEAVELEGGVLRDWKNAVGTGAWILTDYVSDNSMSYDKNPNYWRYDERHPDNRLPYADHLKLLIIADEASRMAAIRTGKIDLLQDVKLAQADQLKKSNPELIVGPRFSYGGDLEMRCDTAPFTDINVRKALQLAVDLNDIAESYYKGTVDGKPCGMISPAFVGYAYAYDDWPQSLKDEYSYNPEKAKQLLADAGYPTGFDTNIVVGSRADLNLYEIIKAQFAEIGVNLEIKLMDEGTRQSVASGGSFDQMINENCGLTFDPRGTISQKYSGNTNQNYVFNNDPDYDQIYLDYLDATTADEQMKLAYKADKYFLEKHWAIVTMPTTVYNFWQPYFKGYSGEYVSFAAAMYWTGCWIDQDTKESMGR